MTTLPHCTQPVSDSFTAPPHCAQLVSIPFTPPPHCAQRVQIASSHACHSSRYNGSLVLMTSAAPRLIAFHPFIGSLHMKSFIKAPLGRPHQSQQTDSPGSAGHIAAVHFRGVTAFLFSLPLYRPPIILLIEVHLLTPHHNHNHPTTHRLPAAMLIYRIARQFPSRPPRGLRGPCFVILSQVTLLFVCL